MRLLALLLASASLGYAITPGQVEAVIQVESSGNPNAIGRLGERGLLQFLPAAWADTTFWRARHGLLAARVFAGGGRGACLAVCSRRHGAVGGL